MSLLSPGRPGEARLDPLLTGSDLLGDFPFPSLAPKFIWELVNPVVKETDRQPCPYQTSRDLADKGSVML